MTDKQIEEAYLEWFAKENNYLLNEPTIWFEGAKWMQEQMMKELKENSIFSSIIETWDNESDEQMGEML